MTAGRRAGPEWSRSGSTTRSPESAGSRGSIGSTPGTAGPARAGPPRTGRSVRWVNLRRLRPFSDRYGYDRGTPIDRFYIERFLEAHANRIHGNVLEVKDAQYTPRFGVGAGCHVIDIDREIPKQICVPA